MGMSSQTMCCPDLRKQTTEQVVLHLPQVDLRCSSLYLYCEQGLFTVTNCLRQSKKQFHLKHATLTCDDTFLI